MSMYELVDWKGLIAEAMETEGRGMAVYTQRYGSYERAALSHFSADVSGWNKALLLVYLGANTLCQDDGYTSAAIIWSDSGLRIQLENLAAQARDALTGAMTPTFVPMVSTWLRRPRQDHETLLARQDLRSFYLWNIAVAHHLREVIDYGIGSSPAVASIAPPATPSDKAVYSRLAYALEQIMVTAKKGLDAAPDTLLVGYICKYMQAKLGPLFTPSQAALVQGVAVLQELHAELKAPGAPLRCDPYMGSAFDTLELRVDTAYKKAFSLTAQRAFQDAAMRSFAEWKKSPLLYSRYGPQQQQQQAAVAALTKAERVLRRTAKVLSSAQAADSAVFSPVVAEVVACLERVEASTSKTQLAQDDVEMAVPSVCAIARSLVRK